MDKKCQLLIVASIMIICTNGETNEYHRHTDYNEETVPKDYEFTDYLTLNELRTPDKEGVGIAQVNVEDPRDNADEYQEEPFQDMLGDDLDTGSIGMDSHGVPDVYEYTDADIYPLTFGNGMSEIKKESDFQESNLDDEYDDPAERGMKFKLADVSGPNSGVYVLNDYPETEQNQRKERNIPLVNSDSTVKRSPFGGTLGPGLPADTYVENDVIPTPSKKYFKSYWNSVFGRLRARQSANTKTRDKFAPKRNRFFGNRVSYFDTLASRLIGK